MFYRKENIMAQVSKYPLSKAVETECFDFLYSTIQSLHDRGEIKEFLDDFLSPVEQIMLAKRLAIALLLGRGYNYETIRKVLRVTPPTIAMVNISLKYKGKGYRKVVDKVFRDEKIADFWQKVDDVIGDLIPPKSKNWSYWRKERWQRKMKSQKSL